MQLKVQISRLPNQQQLKFLALMYVLHHTREKIDLFSLVLYHPHFSHSQAPR